MSKHLIARLLGLLFLAAATNGVGGPALADQVHKTFSVPAGGTSSIFAIPVSNSPVLFSCVTTSLGATGEGQATLDNSTGSGAMHWVGFDGFTAKISTGLSTVAGAHIVYCDAGGFIDLETAGTAGLEVVNKGTKAANVVLMFNY